METGIAYPGLGNWSSVSFTLSAPKGEVHATGSESEFGFIKRPRSGLESRDGNTQSIVIKGRAGKWILKRVFIKV